MVLTHCKIGKFIILFGLNHQPSDQGWQPLHRLNHSCSIHTQTETPQFCPALNILEHTFLYFRVSSGVRLGVPAWVPSVFSMHFTQQTETSVPHTTKCCCEFFVVIWRVLAISILRNRVAAVASFLFLPYPSSVAPVPSTLKLSAIFQIVYLATFVCANHWSLNIMNNCLDLAIASRSVAVSRPQGAGLTHIHSSVPTQVLRHNSKLFNMSYSF